MDEYEEASFESLWPDDWRSDLDNMDDDDLQWWLENRD